MGNKPIKRKVKGVKTEPEIIKPKIIITTEKKDLIVYL